MKRISTALLFVTLGLAGCLPMDFLREKPKPPPKAVEKPPPVVTADEVNEVNASDRARALRAEIEYDKKLRRPAPPPE